MAVRKTRKLSDTQKQIYAEQIYTLYKKYIKSPYNKKKPAINNIKKRLDEYSVKYLIACMMNYSRQLNKNNVESKYRAACHNFFGEASKFLIYSSQDSSGKSIIKSDIEKVSITNKPMKSDVISDMESVLDEDLF